MSKEMLWSMLWEGWMSLYRACGAESCRPRRRPSFATTRDDSPSARRGRVRKSPEETASSEERAAPTKPVIPAQVLSPPPKLEQVVEEARHRDWDVGVPGLHKLSHKKDSGPTKAVDFFLDNNQNISSVTSRQQSLENFDEDIPDNMWQGVEDGHFLDGEVEYEVSAPPWESSSERASRLAVRVEVRHDVMPAARDPTMRKDPTERKCTRPSQERRAGREEFPTRGASLRVCCRTSPAGTFGPHTAPLQCLPGACGSSRRPRRLFTRPIYYRFLRWEVVEVLVGCSHGLYIIDSYAGR
eukprot:1194580-Prorocentrum_minimum.AAC.5